MYFHDVCGECWQGICVHQQTYSLQYYFHSNFCHLCQFNLQFQTFAPFQSLLNTGNILRYSVIIDVTLVHGIFFHGKLNINNEQYVR